MIPSLVAAEMRRAAWNTCPPPSRSATTTLDGLHTYDGAQGTDVVMLLRRLGATIGVATGDRTPRRALVTTTGNANQVDPADLQIVGEHRGTISPPGRSEADGPQTENPAWSDLHSLDGVARVIPSAGAVVIDETGRVLLVRRGREPSKGLWSVPGGKVEPGETPAQAAAREVTEETGYTVAVGDWLWTFTVDAGPGAVFRIHDFAATVTGGSLRAADDAEQVAWFTPDELVDLPVTDGLLDHLERAGVPIPGRAVPHADDP